MQEQHETRALGVLLVDKPAGPSSHDIVDWVRFVLKERSIGHCGTLDPAATGLMVLCVGQATRLVPYLTAVDKTYRATFVLGRSTTTGDAQGETLRQAAVEPEVFARVDEVLRTLVGTLELPPPRYSAVHVDGVRAHVRARRGDDVELAARSMVVHGWAEVTLDAASASVEATVHVGKGTYVRSLAEALGERLGVPAHLGALRRLHCGLLEVADAHIVDGLRGEPLETRGKKPRFRVRADWAASSLEAARAGLRARMLSPAAALSLPVILGSETLGRALSLGQSVATEAPPEWSSAVASGRCVIARDLAGTSGFVVARVVRDESSGGVRVEPERVITPFLPLDPAGAA